MRAGYDIQNPYLSTQERVPIFRRIFDVPKVDPPCHKYCHDSVPTFTYITNCIINEKLDELEKVLKSYTQHNICIPKDIINMLCQYTEKIERLPNYSTTWHKAIAIGAEATATPNECGPRINQSPLETEEESSIFNWCNIL